MDLPDERELIDDGEGSLASFGSFEDFLIRVRPDRLVCGIFDHSLRVNDLTGERVDHATEDERHKFSGGIGQFLANLNEIFTFDALRIFDEGLVEIEARCGFSRSVTAIFSFGIERFTYFLRDAGHFLRRADLRQCCGLPTKLLETIRTSGLGGFCQNCLGHVANDLRRRLNGERDAALRG